MQQILSLMFFLGMSIITTHVVGAEGYETAIKNAVLFEQNLSDAITANKDVYDAFKTACIERNTGGLHKLLHSKKQGSRHEKMMPSLLIGHIITKELEDKLSDQCFQLIITGRHDVLSAYLDFRYPDSHTKYLPFRIAKQLFENIELAPHYRDLLPHLEVMPIVAQMWPTERGQPLCLYIPPRPMAYSYFPGTPGAVETVEISMPMLHYCIVKIKDSTTYCPIRAKCVAFIKFLLDGGANAYYFAWNPVTQAHESAHTLASKIVSHPRVKSDLSLLLCEYPAKKDHEGFVNMTDQFYVGTRLHVNGPDL